ncbi:hypothetical protein B0H16DRAFT_1887113 [Mycena metata]|uniref:F-box domain-containing protein n=1 Tax=Mycena metata TaxID=1033252 RepID=A0AAD7IZJ8_9AGAR|nr:hypothetical protein B0H16DRAFT_1887113 [Mycena metata]
MNPRANILSLPNEMTSAFFLHTPSPFPIPPPTTGPLSPTASGHVCPKWREISRSTPTLWRSVSITLDCSRAEEQINLLNTWLSRSRALTTSVALFDHEQPNEEPELPLVSQFLALLCIYINLQHLEVRIPLSSLNIELLGQISTPMLESLKISAECIEIEDEAEPILILPDAPRLFKLTIRYLDVNLALPCTRLTTLIAHVP